MKIIPKKSAIKANFDKSYLSATTRVGAMELNNNTRTKNYFFDYSSYQLTIGNINFFS